MSSVHIFDALLSSAKETLKKQKETPEGFPYAHVDMAHGAYPHQQTVKEIVESMLLDGWRVSNVSLELGSIYSLSGTEKHRAVLKVIFSKCGESAQGVRVGLVSEHDLDLLSFLVEK